MGDYCENIYDKTTDTVQEYHGYCLSNPCLNGGSCVAVGNFFGYCQCGSSYRGTYCEIPIRASGCNPNPW